jgi:hypothetical protein
MKTPRTAPSRFLTMTFFVYIRLAVNVRHTVTVASSPSGTCVARRRRDTTATLARGGGCIDGVAAAWHRRNAIAATMAPTRSEPPQNPKRNHAQGREMVTSLMDTTGRRETHVRHNNTNHKDEGRDRVLAHAERGRKKGNPQSKGDGRDDLDEVVDLLVDRRLLRFRTES